MTKDTGLSHAEVIIKFNDLNRRLSVFNMHIKPWGRLAIANNSDPHGHQGYVSNNVEDISIIEGFVEGLEYKARPNLCL